MVEQGLAPNRTKATALVMAGLVTTGERRLDKPGQLIDPATALTLKSSSRYVSRGGDKLASVADELKLDFTGLRVLDVGASTGGFSDYALSHGAASVVAVDVGTAQLDWRLRNDPRVESREQTDIRELEPIEPLADVALVDVSFVSITKILETVWRQVKPDGRVVAMVKPQFEAGKVVADKYHGVIKDEAVRQEILQSVRHWLLESSQILVEADSKVLGPKGNRERFFVLALKR